MRVYSVDYAGVLIGNLKTDNIEEDAVKLVNSHTIFDSDILYGQSVDPKKINFTLIKDKNEVNF